MATAIRSIDNSSHTYFDKCIPGWSETVACRRIFPAASCALSSMTFRREFGFTRAMPIATESEPLRSRTVSVANEAATGSVVFEAKENLPETSGVPPEATILAYPTAMGLGSDMAFALSAPPRTNLEYWVDVERPCRPKA